MKKSGSALHFFLHDRSLERDDNNNKCTSICGHILIITIAKYVRGRPSVIVESSEISLELFMYETYENIGEMPGKNVDAECVHISRVNPEIHGNTKGCEECEKMGSQWVHLRLCLTCGHVGCCDDSINKHATKHFKKTNHPVIKSYEPGENWK
jgi:Zn-finger in ubiquitin-hydrolases and other protein